MFRRRRRDDPLGTSPDDELDLDATDSGEAIGRNSHGDDTGDARTAESDEPVRAPTTGPYDIADAPDDGLARLDLGGIQVPVPDGVEIRLEVDQESGVVVAAVAVLGPNALQIGAFAAPKKNGIWADVVQEIAEGLRSAGGSADVVDGTWGRELRAKIPMEGPSGQRSVQSARFVGVDGPRWFLRGLFQGPAATDPGQARRLEDVLRGVVVVRGGEAMAPRDPIPLHMPREVAETAADAEADPAAGPGAAENDGDGFSLDPFERGPEITETR